MKRDEAKRIADNLGNDRLSRLLKYVFSKVGNKADVSELESRVSELESRMNAMGDAADGDDSD